ncbi:MAG: hypothetical protein NT079_01560, partial [Candidatus Omnitrophica bacterium]|nr:hypothetical protein [Candidatus Omnitrophota bacterium]
INRLKKTVVIIGMTVAAIGLTAILGHGIRQPLLYFMIEGKSGAMTIYAAILFVAWSLGLIFVESDK